MSSTEFTAYSDFIVSVERSDDDSGDVIITITADTDKITINAGNSLEDADQLHAELAGATKQALDIRDNWQHRPDEEDDQDEDDADDPREDAANYQDGPCGDR